MEGNTLIAPGTASDRADHHHLMVVRIVGAQPQFGSRCGIAVGQVRDKQVRCDHRRPPRQRSLHARYFAYRVFPAK